VPPTDDALALARYRQVQAASRRVSDRVQAIFSGLPPHGIEAEMAGEAGRAIVAAVAAGQLTVAQGAQAFVSAILAAQGAVPDPAGVVAAAALAGVASDGRPLETLLFLPAVAVAQALAAGLAPADAMLRGLVALARYTGTQIADAARAADQVAMTAERRVVMYTRVVQLPACARCIVLAGRTYSYSAGFQRHPLCDCTVKPLTEAQYDAVASPEELLRRMGVEQRRQVFGRAGAEALAAGADLGQVVNARRGMNTATGTTSEGVTRRGWYGQRARAAGERFQRSPGELFTRTAAPRLMPEQILRQAGSREEAVNLLHLYGYLD
jgi:hypothetical protein